LEREMSATSKRDRAIRDGVEPVMSSAKGVVKLPEVDGVEVFETPVVEVEVPEPADES
jgi:hypothetical protein